jgi:predicted Zn-ribbon and HTH transcriptional regulator
MDDVSVLVLRCNAMRVISEGKQVALEKCFREGRSVRQAERLVGVSRGAVQAHYRTFGERPLCRCGESSGHRGWCKYRFEESPKRQRFMQEWHMGIVTEELCEKCDRQATRFEGGTPYCDSCSGTTQSRFEEKKAGLYEVFDPVEVAPVKHVPVKQTSLEKLAAEVRKDLVEPKVEKVISKAERSKFIVASVCKKCGKDFDHDIRKLTSGQYCSRECYETPREAIVVMPKAEVAKRESCFCGRPARHRGRHLGQPSKPVPKDLVGTFDDLDERVIELKPRSVTIIIPQKEPPVSQIEITPKIAMAIWDSLTKEQRYDLLDIDDLWHEGYDDDMRMLTMRNLLLVQSNQEDQ